MSQPSPETIPILPPRELRVSTEVSPRKRSEFQKDELSRLGQGRKAKTPIDSVVAGDVNVCTIFEITSKWLGSRSGHNLARTRACSTWRCLHINAARQLSYFLYQYTLLLASQRVIYDRTGVVLYCLLAVWGRLSVRLSAAMCFLFFIGTFCIILLLRNLAPFEEYG